MSIRWRFVLYGWCGLLLVSTLFPSWVQGRTNDQSYILGVKAYQDGLWDLASQQFAEYLSRYPQGTMASRVYFLQAEAQLQKKRYQKAASIYRDYTKLYPDGEFLDKAYYRLGLCNHKLGDYAAAESAYQKAIDSFPVSAHRQEVQLGLAETQYAQRKFSLARENYRQIVNRFPAHKNRGLALYGLGLSSLDLGDYEQAVASLKRLITEFPDSPVSKAAKTPLAQAYYKYGETLYKKGQYQLAIGNYKLLLEAYADHELAPSAIYNMALCYLGLKQPNMGEAVFKQLLARYLKHELAARAWLQLGGLDFKRRDYTGAVKAYHEAARSPDKEIVAEAVYWLGELRAKQGQLDKALAEFLKLHLQYADQVQWANPARYQAAQIYIRQAKTLAAKKLLLKVIQESTDDKLARMAKDKLQELLEVPVNKPRRR